MTQPLFFARGAARLWQEGTSFKQTLLKGMSRGTEGVAY